MQPRITDQSTAMHRLGVAARRGGARHHRRRATARRSRPRATCRAGARPVSSPTWPSRRDQGLDQATRAAEGHPRREGHARQAVHRRSALHARSQGFVDAAEAVAQNLRTGAARSASSPTTTRPTAQLDASLENLQAMTARINAGEGSLGKLLNDEAFAQSLTSTTANLDAHHRPASTVARARRASC